MSQYQSQPISQWPLGSEILSTNVFTSTDTTNLTQSPAGSTFKYTMAQLLAFVEAGVQLFNWVDVTSPTQQLAVQTGYVCDAGNTNITFTLPTDASLGSLIRILAPAPGLFNIQQNAGQQITLLNSATSVGNLGSLVALNQHSSIELTCIKANQIFQISSITGQFNFL